MIRTTKKIVSLLSVIGLLVISASALSAKGHLNVASKAEKIITVVNPQGQRVQKRIPAAKVLPGEIVQYSTIFENISNNPADNINITNPIPTHTIYLPGTAHGNNCNIVYSVDGGKKWGKPNHLKVRGKNGKWLPAKPSDYTHIRWEYQGDLMPREKKAVSFRVRLL